MKMRKRKVMMSKVIRICIMGYGYEEKEFR